jgi:hypothetical protein
MQLKLLIPLIVLASQISPAARADSYLANCQLPPAPLGSIPSDGPAELAPFQPTSLSDLRLRLDLPVAPGTPRFANALKDAYSFQLRRYAEKLIRQKQYKQASSILDLAISSTSKPESITRQLRAETNLAIASTSTSGKKNNLYQKVLVDSNILLSEYVLDLYAILKARALIGLGSPVNKKEAIKCLSETYSHAQIFGNNTARLSRYLLQLTGKTKPDAAIAQRDVDKVGAVISALNKSAAPSREEVEALLKANLIQRKQKNHESLLNKKDQSELFSEVWFEQSLAGNRATTVSLTINPATASLTMPMVQKWLPLVENKAIYPWGEIVVYFNYPGDLATSFTFTWKDSLDAAEKQKKQDAEVRAARAVFPDQPTLAYFRKTIENLIANGRYKEALTQACISLGWVGSPPSKEVKDALRPLLVRLKEGENKSEIAAYLRQAPFAQIAIFLEQIQSGEKGEFLTLKDYAARNYYLKGRMTKDFTGNCEITGGRDFAPVSITDRTDAAEKLFSALKVEVPFDYTDTYLKISPPPGLLIDDVLDQQQERAAKLLERSGDAPLNAGPSPLAP